MEEAGFEEYLQLSVSPEAVAYVLPGLTGVTSRRRLAATAPLGEVMPAAAWEQD